MKKNKSPYKMRGFSGFHNQQPISRENINPFEAAAPVGATAPLESENTGGMVTMGPTEVSTTIPSGTEITTVNKDIDKNIK